MLKRDDLGTPSPSLASVRAELGLSVPGYLSLVLLEVQLSFL